jgi:hypothetical protein
MAAFGMPIEPEPGVLAIADNAVMAVQLVKLRPDGSGKADIKPNKIIIGQGALGSPIVLAPPNDLLGLAITEGIDDALSIHEATGSAYGQAATRGACRRSRTPFRTTSISSLSSPIATRPESNTRTRSRTDFQNGG